MTVSINGIEQTRPELSTHDTALAAVQTDLGNPSVRSNLQSILALLGNPDTAGKSLYDNLGDFVGLNNFASLLALLGIPDVSGKSLYTLLVTDRLDHGTFGLSQLRTDIAAIPTTMVGTNLAFLANVGGLLDTAAATGAVSSAKLLMAYVKQLVTLLLDGTYGLSALETLVDGIESQTDKLAGTAPTVGSVTTNWNTPADICTIGADGVSNKVLSLTLAIDAATAGAVITVNMYMQVDGVERKVYSQNFLKGTDPDGLWIIQSVVAIHEALRVEIASDVSESVEFDFDYMLEVM